MMDKSIIIRIVTVFEFYGKLDSLLLSEEFILVKNTVLKVLDPL